jgi:hypothetical protein
MMLSSVRFWSSPLLLALFVISILFSSTLAAAFIKYPVAPTGHPYTASSLGPSIQIGSSNPTYNGNVPYWAPSFGSEALRQPLNAVDLVVPNSAEGETAACAEFTTNTTDGGLAYRGRVMIVKNSCALWQIQPFLEPLGLTMVLAYNPSDDGMGGDMPPIDW